MGDQVAQGGLLRDSLNSTDMLDGAGGYNKLIATVDGNNAAAGFTITPASLKNIQEVQVTNANTNGGGQAATIALTNAGQVEKLATTGNSADVVFSNVQTALKGLAISNNATNVTVNSVAAALAGAADELNVRLESVTAGTLDVGVQGGTGTSNGYETIVIESAGTVANTVTALASTNAADAATLKVKGAQNLTITNTLETGTKTVDAADFTGKLNVTQTNTVAVNITGGSGDDTFTLGASFIGAEDATVANRDVINGGDGRDTLSITSARAVAASAAKQTTVSNIEILTISDALGGALDLTKFDSVDTLKLEASTAAQRAITAKTGTTLDFDADQNAFAVTVGGTATDDVFTLKMDGFDLAAATTFAGVEVLNINTGTTVTGDAKIDGTVGMTATAGGTTKVVATGVNSLDINAAFTTAEIDASGLSGNAILDMNAKVANAVKITGGAKNDIIWGSDSNDVIISGAGNDNVRAYGGDDVIDISGGGSNTLVFEADAATNGKDTITGFNVGAVADGGDVLNTGAFITKPGALTAVTSLTGGATVANDSIITVNYANAIADIDFGAAGAAGFDLLFGAGKAFSTTIAANAESVLVVQGTDTTKVYYIDNDADTTLASTEVVLVGTLNGVTNADTFLLANFA